MDTIRYAGMNLILLLAAGLALVLAGAWRQELDVRETLAQLLLSLIHISEPTRPY